MTDDKPLYRTIWLAPHCAECMRNFGEDITWCQENIYEPCEECGRHAVRYEIAEDRNDDR